MSNKLLYKNIIASPVFTSPYGSRIEPVWKKNYIATYGLEKFKQLPQSELDKHIKLHNGIDMVSGVGDLNIKCPSPGEVIKIENDETKNSGGRYVIVQHENNLITEYCHLETIKVYKGQKLDKGDVIGIMGKTGNSTAVHLHFMVKANGTVVNPDIYFS